MKKYLLITLIFAFCVNLFAQNQEGQGVERYALYIASNLGGEDRETLRYAGSDAKKLSETMIELGGVKKQNSFVLVDSTKAEIDGAFNNITAIINNSKASAKRVEFLFYYSGHSDENALLLGEESYDYAELKAKISDVPSDVHVVVLDSCFSGNFIRAKGGSRQKSFLVDDSSVVKGHAYLSSSSETESSQESDDIEASYFTQALITGLRGAADTSGDSRVSLNELYYYAFNETLKQTETSAIGTQHPSFDITLVGSGDLVLTDISAAEAVLVLPSNTQGRFLIRTLEGKLAAEINKANDTVMSLALPQGFYTVTVIGNASTTQSAVKLSKNTVYTLETSTFKEVDLTQGVARGSSDAETTNRPSENIEVSGTQNESSRPNTTQKYLTDEEIDRLLNSDDDVESKSDKKESSSKQEKSVTFDGTNLCTNEKVLLAGFILPGLGIPKDAEDVRFVVSPFMTSQHCVEGAQISSFMGIVTNYLAGFQISGFGSIASGEFRGFQSAGFMNIANGDFKGFQTAGFMNTAKGSFRGVQSAGFLNIANGYVDGIQASGFLNIAKGNFTGIQASSFINIAGKMRGLQIGIINIAEDNDGVSIGLLNFIKNGICDPAIYWENDEIYLQYQGGTNWFYTTFLAGTSNENYFDYGVIGAGLGARIGKDFFGLDTELLFKQTLCGGLKDEIPEEAISLDQELDSFLVENSNSLMKYSYPSLRIAMNFRFGKDFGLFVAVNNDLQIEGVNDNAFQFRKEDTVNSFTLGNTNLKTRTYWTFGLKF